MIMTTVGLYGDEPAKDPALLLTTILADATNMGLAKMVESCRVDGTVHTLISASRAT